MAQGGRKGEQGVALHCRTIFYVAVYCVSNCGGTGHKNLFSARAVLLLLFPPSQRTASREKKTAYRRRHTSTHLYSTPLQNVFQNHVPGNTLHRARLLLHSFHGIPTVAGTGGAAAVIITSAVVPHQTPRTYNLPPHPATITAAAATGAGDATVTHSTQQALVIVVVLHTTAAETLEGRGRRHGDSLQGEVAVGAYPNGDCPRTAVAVRRPDIVPPWGRGVVVEGVGVRKTV